MMSHKTPVLQKPPVRETPIVAEDSLYLFHGNVRWDYLNRPQVIRKFVRSFQKAWMQIPDKDRQTLQEHWKSLQNGSGCTRSPLIGFDMLARCRTAACRGGVQLDFNVHYVDGTKPRELVCVIAHELGHAISWAHGWFEQHECLSLRGVECVACECRASSYVAAWGFDVRLVTPIVFSQQRRR